MSLAVTYAILEVAERSGDQGISMGTLVDTLEQRGYPASDTETEVWRLMGLRRLTPAGFVCRTVQRRGEGPNPDRLRIYEFTLVPWSPELDRQLELKLDE